MTSKKTHSPKPRPMPAAGPASKSFQVLVADDHDIVHHGLKQLLADAFGNVAYVLARDTQEAIAQYPTQKWDVVLMDITMPGRSGLDVLAELKQLRPAIPILIMSAFPEEEFALRALHNGADGYIDKRMIAQEIITAIKHVIAGERYVSMTLAKKLATQIGNHSARPAHETLSTREFQVLRLIAAGKMIKEIAQELTLSEKTVGTYRTRISEKLGLGTNVELTRYALQHRLVS